MSQMARREGSEANLIAAQWKDPEQMKMARKFIVSPFFADEVLNHLRSCREMPVPPA
jgi:hypothetical protein